MFKLFVSVSFPVRKVQIPRDLGLDGHFLMSSTETNEYHEAKLSDGWVLYYSEEGYPYYYKELTGESEWAPYDYSQSGYYDETHTPVEEADNGESDGEDDDIESEGSGDSESEEDSEDGSESDDGEGDREVRGSTKRGVALDKDLEAKFLEYLKTPEGMAAAEAELQRVGRKFEKRAAKKSREAEKDYIRDLSSRKKDHAAAKPGAGIAGFAALTTSVLESTNAWMFPKPASKQPDKKKATEDSKALKRKGSEQASKYDEYNRETKHRHVGPHAPEEQAFTALEGGKLGGSRSPTYSRSSSVSSETESFSSDDSDIEQIDAPLFSEIPQWFSWNNLAARWFSAQHTATAASEGTGNSSTTSPTEGSSETTPTSTALIPYIPENLINLAYLQSASTALAQQSFMYLGGAFVQGFGLLFEHLNPVLENFVATMIDDQPSATARQPQRRGRRMKDDDDRLVEVVPSRTSGGSHSARASSSRAMSSRTKGAIAREDRQRPATSRPAGPVGSAPRGAAPHSARAAAGGAPRPSAPPLRGPAYRSAVHTPRMAIAAQPPLSSLPTPHTHDAPATPHSPATAPQTPAKEWSVYPGTPALDSPSPSSPTRGATQEPPQQVDQVVSEGTADVVASDVLSDSPESAAATEQLAALALGGGEEGGIVDVEGTGSSHGDSQNLAADGEPDRPTAEANERYASATKEPQER